MMIPEQTVRIAFLVLACGLLSAGCDREHMSHHYGRRTREFNARQHVFAQAAVGSPKGLDSEESELIHQSYRESLGAEPEQGQGGGNGSKIFLIQDRDQNQDNSNGSSQ